MPVKSEILGCLQDKSKSHSGQTLIRLFLIKQSEFPSKAQNTEFAHSKPADFAAADFAAGGRRVFSPYIFTKPARKTEQDQQRKKGAGMAYI